MWIYYVVMVLLLLPALIKGRLFCFDTLVAEYENDETVVKRRKLYTIYAGLIIFVISAFRDFSVGTDTASYVYDYVFQSYKSSGVWLSSEAGYDLFCSILQKLNVSPRWFLIICSVFITYSFSRLLYKYCSNIALGFFTHFTIGLFAMSLSGLRQTIACCLVLLAFEQMNNKKFIRYIIFTLIGVLFHYSAIVTVPLGLTFFTKRKSEGRIKSLVIPISIIAFYFVFNGVIYKYMLSLASKRYFINGYFDSLNDDTNVLVYIFSIGLVLTCISLTLIGKKKLSGLDVQFMIIETFYLVTIIMGSMVYMANRLSYYFLAFIAIILPNSLGCVNNKYRPLMSVLMIIVCAGYFAVSVPGGSMGIEKYIFGW